MEYILFQMKLEVLKDNPLASLGSEYISNFDTFVVKDNYNQVCSARCADRDSLRTLERLFEKYNIDQPQGYKGRSMSVTDVVVFIRGNKSEYWFCDSVGFKKINGLKWLGELDK